MFTYYTPELIEAQMQMAELQAEYEEAAANYKAAKRLASQSHAQIANLFLSGASLRAEGARANYYDKLTEKWLIYAMYVREQLIAVLN